MVAFTMTDASVGLTDTPVTATSAAVTVTLQLAITPLTALALTVASPGDTAVTIPS